ncbi:MAG: peptidyl-prolyl cis-trans isomerase [bacterium]
MDDEHSKSEGRARTLLMVGAALGLLLGVAGILQKGPSTGEGVPEKTAALVNGVAIEVEEFERAVGLLAADSKNVIGPPERKHVLDRLIEEELLVQRARELGVDQHDRRVRSLLVRQMIDSIVADAQPDEPSQSELEYFYEVNQNYFARTGRIWVDPLRFTSRPGQPAAEAQERARAATERLRDGDNPAEVKQQLADPWVIPFPRGLLPPTKVREYLGPTPTRAALTLGDGEVSDPVRGGSAWYVLRLVEATPGQVPPLAQVEKEVRSEMQRRAGDTALRSYLDNLRERGDVRVGDTVGEAN